MTRFNFTYDLNVTLQQRIGFEMAAAIWSTYLTDDVTINLQIGATTGLNNNQAVGGAVPIFHEVNYGVYQQYLKKDATSAEDASVIAALQKGNTVDLLVDTDNNTSTASELVDGNTSMMLTRAQAKALGMQKALTLDTGGTWDRDVIQDANALDGYIVINNSFNWGYDLTRQGDAATGTLDFLTMALHEIGHSMGFVSGLDGLVETFTMYSGEARTKGFTALDLMRYSQTSAKATNPDGSVSELSFGGSAYFSLDGGATVVAEFEEGNEYQASHWQRYREAIGIMDPTLGYQERTNISQLDLKAFDVLGWNVNYAAFGAGLNLNALYQKALLAVGGNFGVGVAAVEGALAQGQDWYTLARGSFWEALKTQMIARGYGNWWTGFESQLNSGSGSWWQDLDQQMLKLGSGSWWQVFESKVLALGSGSWWQTFQSQMLSLGSGSWWQVFEPTMLKQGFGGVWQVFEKQMFALGYGDKWQELEAQLLALGSGSWWQALEPQILKLGSGSWWQAFENKVFELGSGSWWQTFQSDLLKLSSGSWWLGSGSWWQVFELSSGSWWLAVENHQEELESHTSTAFNANASNTVTGGESDDILAGGTVGDLISGKAGDDLIDGKAGNDLLLGDDGNDIVYGWEGNDSLYGGTGDDLLTGENGDDLLSGEAGHDILSGGRGKDVLIGGEGRDVLKGDTEDDLLDGGNGNDQLTGGSGNDLLVGGAGQDNLDGGEGDDILYGDAYFDRSTTTTASTNTVSYNQSTTAPAFWVRMEAESMRLINYNLDNLTGTSGGQVIATNATGRGNSKARTTFSGPNGTYDLIVGYYDQGGDTATLTLNVGQGIGASQYVISLNGTTGLRTFTIPGVKLTSGVALEFQGSAAGADLARLDYLDIVTAGTRPSFDASGNPIGQLKLMKGTRGQGVVQRIEAESLILGNGYQLLADATASGKTVINNVSTSSNYATATYTYTGESGTFNLYADYFDNSVGNAELRVLLNGTELTKWRLERNSNTSFERLVGVNLRLNAGDTLQVQGRADGNDRAIVDYLVLEQTNAADSALTPIVGSRVEVESMTLAGLFKIETSKSFASGSSLVFSNDKVTGFTASTLVQNSGLYDIVIGYYDENDGLARYTASVAGAQLATWQSTLNLGDANASSKSFITKTLRGVLLNSGDTFNLQSIAEGSDKGYLDYVEFRPYNPTPTVRVDAEYMNATGDFELREFTFASQGRTVRSRSTDVTKTVNLSTIFDGPAGRYTMVIGYYDENDGLAQFTTSVNGVRTTSWVANANLGFNDVAVQTFTTRTIAGLDLNPGDQILLTSLRESGDYGQVDYIEFLPTQVQDANALQIEVEDMDLAGKSSIKTGRFAFGGAYVETDDDKTGFTGTTWFTGESGYYKVIVGYYDDNEGAAEISLKIDSKAVDRWYADKNFGSNKPEPASFTTRTATEAVYINKTDLIEIQGIEGGNDRVNLDYIKFVAVDAPVARPTDTVTVDPAAVDADILRGGVGNDTIFGGQGNDLLYGDAGNDLLYGDYETEQTSRVVQGQQYNGNSYLLTQTAMTWTQAQAQAQTLGGNLVTINDAAEAAWLKQTFGTAQQFWIGLNDQAVNTQFQWVSGAPVTYTNFESGRIDDPNRSFFAMNKDSAGAWSDEGSTTVFLGLIEISGVSTTPATSGNDQLTGGSGNDTLNGGAGNDTLTGTDGVSRGVGERDVLLGGSGADRFVLGDWSSAYYLGGGSNDFAVIQDFTAGTDIVQLRGSAANYTTTLQGTNTLLSFGQDLVAQFTGVTSVNLASSSFQFV